MREKTGKSRNTVFFPVICGSGGSKSRLAKAAGAEPAGQMSDEKLHAVVARSTFRSQNVQKHTSFGPLLEVEMRKKCTPSWREAHFELKMYKAPQRRTTFGGWDVEKVHAVVARSTFRSENVQNMSAPDHFWKLRCRKSARRCGAKHISKSKMYKAHHSRTTFGSCDVEKVHAVVARSTFRSQNVKSSWGSDHFWRFRCGFASLHYITLHYTTLHYNYNYTTTLDYTPLDSTTLNYTTLHYITLQLHYTEWHCTTDRQVDR